MRHNSYDIIDFCDDAKDYFFESNYNLDSFSEVNGVVDSNSRYAVNNYVPVDVSHSALVTLYNLGYRRVSFVLSENHPKRDICDRLYSQYGLGTNRFMQLKTLIDKAPIFGNNPPAPLYGLTHPNCRCHFLVFPPKYLKDLTIPNMRLTQEQKEILLSTMYPQEVNALSYSPEVRNINFDQYIETKQLPPIENKELKDKPWYSQIWDFIKKKIFRKASLNEFSVDFFYRYADSIYVYGDIVRLISDYIDTDYLVYTKIPEGSVGFVLSEYPYEKGYYLVFFINYSFIKKVPQDLLSYEYDTDKYKGYYFDKRLNDYLEVPILRRVGTKVTFYNPFDNSIKEVFNEEIKSRFS